MNVAVGLLFLIAAILGEEVRISAPDIDPLDGTFNRSIRVAMVANAKSATIRYTLDNTPPSERSSAYKEPIDLVGRGEFIVRAVAYSEVVGRRPSVEARRVYFIRAVDTHPTIFPASQTIRGGVNVSIITPPGYSSEYLLDFETRWKPYKDPFTVNAVGQRTIKARIQGAQDPIVVRQYLITPSLVYDVTANCATCGGIPTRCRPFTVWLQGARDRSLLFLSTSSQGCEKINHVLDGTSMLSTDSRNLAYTFQTSADPGKVWICIAESADTNGPFVPVPQHNKAESWFTLKDSAGSCELRETLTATGAPVQVSVTTETTGISSSSILLWGVIVAVVAWFVLKFRGSN